jgi:hypothetical protein
MGVRAACSGICCIDTLSHAGNCIAFFDKCPLWVGNRRLQSDTSSQIMFHLLNGMAGTTANYFAL